MNLPWGPGTFENDVAHDWIEDLGDSDAEAFLCACIDLSDQGAPNYVACVGVLCAAETLLGLITLPECPRTLPESLMDWLRSNAKLNAQPLVAPAIISLYQVTAENSELRQLWEDDHDRFQTWRDSIYELIDSLNAHQTTTV